MLVRNQNVFLFWEKVFLQLSGLKNKDVSRSQIYALLVQLFTDPQIKFENVDGSLEYIENVSFFENMMKNYELNHFFYMVDTIEQYLIVVRKRDSNNREENLDKRKEALESSEFLFFKSYINDFNQLLNCVIRYNILVNMEDIFYCAKENPLNWEQNLPMILLQNKNLPMNEILGLTFQIQLSDWEKKPKPKENSEKKTTFLYHDTILMEQNDFYEKKKKAFLKSLTADEEAFFQELFNKLKFLKKESSMKYYFGYRELISDILKKLKGKARKLNLKK